MNIKFNYLDNILPITDTKITSVEIENKGYFYRTTTNFIKISDGELIEEIYFFDENKEELTLANKIMVISDYFNFEIIMKKYSSHLQKLIIENTDEKIINDITMLYKKVIKKMKIPLENIDFKIEYNNDFNIEQLLKLLKPNITLKDNIIDNLYLIIDLEKTFKFNKLLIFINLKQYLDKEDLEEFYKYCIYNKISILLIENMSHQIPTENEQKLIIDADLDEFML